MSLVERAIKKLQDSRGGALPSGVSAPLPTVAAAQVVTLQQDDLLDAAAPRRIVSLDREALRQMELLPPTTLERQIGSQYQQIKRPLVASALGRTEQPLSQANLIMLASALPGEGKTFTSLNLALSMAAEKDVKVLLVDADVAKPHITRLLGLENEPGLLDLLSDSTLTAESLVLPTNIPGLSVLPSGAFRDNATELLASSRMTQIVAELGDPRRRRIVLFDSPPLLLSTESQALLHAVGQVVLVVRADFTPQKAVLEALEFIQTKPTSLILNQSENATAASYYGYGHYGAASTAADLPTQS